MEPFRLVIRIPGCLEDRVTEAFCRFFPTGRKLGILFLCLCQQGFGILPGLAADGVSLLKGRCLRRFCFRKDTATVIFRFFPGGALDLGSPAAGVQLKRGQALAQKIVFRSLAAGFLQLCPEVLHLFRFRGSGGLAPCRF